MSTYGAPVEEEIDGNLHQSSRTCQAEAKMPTADDQYSGWVVFANHAHSWSKRTRADSCKVHDIGRLDFSFLDSIMNWKYINTKQ
jgi:hypothetical protein